VNVKVPSVSMVLDLNLPTHTTVWGMSSRLVQVTVWPTFTVSCAGTNTKLSMCTATSSARAAPAGRAATALLPAGAARAEDVASPVAVHIDNFVFVPAQLTVKVGQTVTWTNQDDVDHNVVATKGAKFESDNFGKGGTYSYKATKPGTIQYTCTLHPGMDGTLTVTS